MSEPITINPQELLNPGLDYAFLKAEGTAIVQRLAGEIWTDYNESDPGVTTLEQLCYALTELSYRAEFPLADLLIDPRTRKIEARRQALFPARQIFPCNPVTERDYRKLLLDRIPEIGNVWLTPHRCRESKRCVDGLWDIEIYLAGLAPQCPPPEEEEREVRNRVRRVYCRHRNLCEDLRAIRFLRPVRTVVHADVSLAEGRTPEAVLAGILFNVGLLLAPEPRRQSLKSLVDEGVPSSRIFEGPLLLNGFIADEELQPRAKAIPVQEVVRAIAKSAGVAGVRHVKVRTGDKTYTGNECVPVPRHGVLQLDTRADGKRGFSIRLLRNGIEIQPNPARVRRELERLWAEQRRTYPLAAQYGEYFGFPAGKVRDLARYYSIQNQYPNVYGINAYGVPAGASEVRKAQAKQLKGYLLVFDQLLADFFAQLAHVRELYATETGPTYFSQSLVPAVPDVLPLLIGGVEGYERGLRRIVREQDPAVERRNRFLSFLLALYAEGLDAASIWDLALDDQEDEDTSERLLRARLALLRHLVPATHNRGRGFDYLERPSPGNVAGMTIKSRIQLGMGPFDRRQLYIVEHNLLRFGRFRERQPDETFEYSFTLTAVLATPADLEDDADYRRFAREVIRENAPAHIVVDYCFLPLDEMPVFEERYDAWRRALREQDRRQIHRTSASLRRFLAEKG